MRVSCTVLPCSQVPPQLAQRVTAQFEAVRVMHQVIQDAVDAAAQQPPLVKLWRKSWIRTSSIPTV